MNTFELNKLDSYSLYTIINKALSKEESKAFLINNGKSIMNKITSNYNIFDCMSLYNLLKVRELKKDINELLDKTVNQLFNKDTIFFIRLINKKIIDLNTDDKNAAFNIIFMLLETYNSEKASILINNMILFQDFREELGKRYKIVEVLLSKYQEYDKNAVYENSYKGSSILGCLIKGNNQYLAFKYLNDLLDKEHEKMKNICCIGGGSTCLVYRIGKSVLKLGENRNERKIYVNHRILASQLRKLLKNGNKELFYVEIMKYIRNTGISQAECDELQEDLLRQGLIWEDAKIENCGILDDDDANESHLPVDYVEVAGIVDNPCDREAFMKRKKKVVVLDNDNIRRDPKSLWR